jgi:hypothetical protein
MTDHHCNAACSHRVTVASLRNMGYEIADPRRDAGAMEKAAWQMQFSNLRYQAYRDGKVRICTRTLRITEHEQELARKKKRR